MVDDETGVSDGIEKVLALQQSNSDTIIVMYGPDVSPGFDICLQAFQKHEDTL